MTDDVHEAEAPKVIVAAPFDNIIKAYAAHLGIHPKDLTEEQKRQALDKAVTDAWRTKIKGEPSHD